MRRTIVKRLRLRAGAAAVILVLAARSREASGDPPMPPPGTAPPAVTTPPSPATTSPSPATTPLPPATTPPPPGPPPTTTKPRASAEKPRSDPSTPAPDDFWRRRYEPAGFPLIAGSSDTGVQLGVVGTLSYFSNGVRPYLWNQDLFASLSVKGREGGGSGIEIAQKALQWNIDWLGLFGGHVRLNPQASYTRTINVGYFGLGNESNDAAPPAGNPDPSRYHEFVENTLYARTLARIDLAPPYYLMTGATVRYVVPEAYAGSKLAVDERQTAPGGGPLIYGTRPLTLASVAAGGVYDSRDNEIYTRKGMYHVVGARFEEGVPLGDDVRYAELGALLAGFVPIGPNEVFATRLLANAQLGHVPFYDLLVAGPFQLKEAIGGSSAIRGVPIGRYLGPFKILANFELRALPFQVTLLHQQFRIGGDVFVDTGRVFSAPRFSSYDGSGIGLKYGVGFGGYLLWGQAAIFRVEAAYSPDAAATGGLPIGLYVEDGTMF